MQHYALCHCQHNRLPTQLHCCSLFCSHVPRGLATHNIARCETTTAYTAYRLLTYRCYARLTAVRYPLSYYRSTEPPGSPATFSANGWFSAASTGSYTVDPHHTPPVQTVFTPLQFVVYRVVVGSYTTATTLPLPQQHTYHAPSVLPVEVHCTSAHPPTFHGCPVPTRYLRVRHCNHARIPLATIPACNLLYNLTWVVCYLPLRAACLSDRTDGTPQLAAYRVLLRLCLRHQPKKNTGSPFQSTWICGGVDAPEGSPSLLELHRFSRSLVGPSTRVTTR